MNRQKKINLMYKNIKKINNSLDGELLYLGYDINYVLSDKCYSKILENSDFNDNTFKPDTNYNIKKMIKFNPQYKHKPNDINPTIWSFKNIIDSEFSKHLVIKKYEKILEQNYKKIKEEFNNILNHLEIHPENNITNKTGQWKRISIIGVDNKYNQKIVKYIPTLKKILDEFNIAYGFGFVFFSRTYPNTFIEPHYGSSNLRSRIHLGIDIPEPDSTSITVNGLKKNWKNGGAFTFNDSYLHSSINNGTKPRDILIIDVFNPLLNGKNLEFFKKPEVYNFGKLK